MLRINSCKGARVLDEIVSRRQPSVVVRSSANLAESYLVVLFARLRLDFTPGRRRRLQDVAHTRRSATSVAAARVLAEIDGVRLYVVLLYRILLVRLGLDSCHKRLSQRNFASTVLSVHVAVEAWYLSRQLQLLRGAHTRHLLVRKIVVSVIAVGFAVEAER